MEIRDVADLLGHRNIETTENYYISSTEASRKKANIVFEEITQSSIIKELSKIEKTINLSTDDNLFTTCPHSINNVDRIKKISKNGFM